MFQSAPVTDLVYCLHPVRSEHANPLHFLVGEVCLFFLAGAFYVAQSQFLRDTAELSFRYAEQERNSCLRDVFRDLIVHDLPHAATTTMESTSTTSIIVL